MRVCIISNPNSVHVRRSLDFLIERGHELAFIGYAPPEQPLPAGVSFLNLPARFNVRKLRYLVWPLLVRRWIRQIQPEVLHAHFVNSAGWLGAQSGYHPFLLTAHGSDLLLLSEKSWMHQLLSKQALQKADYLTCGSQWLLEKALALGVPPDRAKVVPLGVDTDLFAPASDKQALRSALGLGTGPILLSLRPFKPIYNPFLVAQALPVVLQKFPTAQLVCFTANAEAQTLAQFRSLIEVQNLSHAVKYVAPLWNDRAVADYTCTADVGISVASSDSASKSVQEAMACEVPVIAGDVPALRERIEHDVNGLLIPLGGPEALAAAIIRLLENGDLRRTLGKQARLTICERADSERWMARSEEIYYELVCAHGKKKGTP